VAKVNWDRSVVGKTLSPALRNAMEDYGERDYVPAAKRAIGTRFPPASAPGRTPHLRTGFLQQSMRAVTFQTPREISLQMGSDAFYSPHLELGTSTMRARPFLRPVLGQTRRLLAKRLEKIGIKLPKVSRGLRRG